VTIAEKEPFVQVPITPSVEKTERWVRIEFEGEMLADSKRALLLIQYGRAKLPTYFFPRVDVRIDLLTASEDTEEERGTVFWHLQVGDRISRNAAYSHLNPEPDLEALTDYISFKWHKVDHWYEEEEEIFVHARDPHKRVDAMPSSRHIRVEIDEVTAAETDRPVLLFETNLPTRYYIPGEDVNWHLFEAASRTTACPYKGTANYWSAMVGDKVEQNIMWSYPKPIDEMPKIKDLYAFFNERVDIFVDGELEPRPITAWSPR